LTKLALPVGWAEQAGVDAQRILGAPFTLRNYDPTELSGSLESDWSDVNALVFTTRPLQPGVMEQLRGLRMISIPGTGVWDYVDVAKASELNIAICNVPDYASRAIAEYTIGLMIALVRHIVESDRNIRTAGWPRSIPATHELWGKVLGIVGLGSIGSRVAEMATDFGMRVVCTTRTPERQRQIKCPVEFVNLDTLMRTADVVTVHAALTDETKHLIGRQQLALLKPSAYFINTARGGLIDELALVERLNKGMLAGAALDVFASEPLPLEHPLRTAPNVIVTAHVAGATDEAIATSVVRCLENVRRFFEGRPTHVINAASLWPEGQLRDTP
jgi:phosphoglycerate dehydrogenase-like enzyme